MGRKNQNQANDATEQKPVPDEPNAIPTETPAPASADSAEATQAESQTAAAENTAEPENPEAEVYIEILKPTSIGIKNYLQGAKIDVPAALAKELIANGSAKPAN